MANQIEKPKKSQFPAMISGEKIEYSTALVEAIQRQTDAGDATSLPYLPRAVVAEAREAAEAIEAKYLSPPDPAELRNFLVKLHHSLNAIAVKPVDNQTLELRISAAQLVLSDAPRCAFGDNFAKVCFSRFKWQPTPAELLELAAELAQNWRDRASKVRMVVLNDNCKRFTLGYAPPSDEPEQLTNEQTTALNNSLNGVLGKFNSKREAARD